MPGPVAHTIILKGRGVRKEAPAGGTITPGHLVDLNSSGQLVVQATAAIKVAALFAVENDIQPQTYSPPTGTLAIDKNYVAGDYVQAEFLDVGSEVYALVPAAAAAIVIGDKLESAGAGTLRKLASGIAMFEALEAVDNSGGGTAARIRVVVI